MLDANKLGAFGILIADKLQDALDDLSPSAAALLSMLHFKPGLTGSELAAVVGIAQPTAVRILEGLVRQGFVDRLEPQGRATPLVLTESGKARASALQHARLAALAGLLAPLPEADRSKFEAIMDVILAEATTSRAFARTTCRLCEHDLCSAELCPIGCRATALERAGCGQT